MIGRFLSYIEIKTKITSISPFLMVLAYLFYIEQPIRWRVTWIFFGSMFLFDLTTTAINNYIDTKTNQQILQFQRNFALTILLALLLVSMALGLYLVILTDIVVLLVGGLCFIVGILYTFGPVPISRLPLGEIVSGVFYGFFIPFLLFYINMPEGTFLTFDCNTGSMTLLIRLNILPLLTVFLLSVAPMFTTANIMLANNICDLEKDIANKRYTLPYFIHDKALPLFAWLYYMTYFTTILMVLLNILAPIVLFSLLTIFFVQKNIKQFYQVQKKESTFLFSIQNYIIIIGTNTFFIFLSGII